MKRHLHDVEPQETIGLVERLDGVDGVDDGEPPEVRCPAQADLLGSGQPGVDAVGFVPGAEVVDALGLVDCRCLLHSRGGQATLDLVALRLGCVRPVTLGRGGARRACGLSLACAQQSSHRRRGRAAGLGVEHGARSLN